MSQAKLSLSALDAVTSSKEKLFSIGLGTSNCNSKMKTQSHISPQFQFNSTNSLLPPFQNSMGSKPRKRTRSKSGLKSRKKGKRGTSSNSPDDGALDTDIFAFVETLDTNKNLDSDSSTNTIIIDDLNNQISSSNLKDVESKLCFDPTDKRTKANPGEILFSDMNFQGRNDNHLPRTATSPFNTFSILPQKNDGNSLSLNCKEIRTNFYNSSKGRVLIPPGKSPVPGSQYFPLVKHSNIGGVSQSLVHSESSVSLLSKVNDINDKFMFNREKNQDGNTLFLGTSSINSVLISPSNPISNLSNYVVNHPLPQHCLINEKSAKLLSGAQVSEVKQQLPKSSVSSTSLFSPNVYQSDQKLNSQSVYASMGLDEDLCDLDIQKPKQVESSKLSSKDTHSSLIPKEVNSVQLLNKIKTENSQLFTSSCTTKNNSLAFDAKSEIFSQNDLHVSMTFEAEPSVEEDEDDLPLSELKNQMSVADIIPKLKKKAEEWSKVTTDNVSDIHPSLFIKKELIEDEIVSESEAVSSLNVLSSSAPSSNNTEVKTSISSACNDFTAVKIKAEPKDDFPGTEPIDSFPFPLNYNPAHGTSYNTGLIPEVIPGAKHTSLELANENTSLAYGSIGNAVPSLSPVSDFTSKDSNLTENISDTSVTLTKKSKTNKKRKLSNKNTKVVSKNVKISSAVDVELNKSLLKEALQSVNVCERNSDLNSSLSVTDTDTESNSSKKRGKKKKKAESIEDVPISQLIKAQKPNESDQNPSNSFLCSNKSRPSVGETKLLSAFSAADKVLIGSQEKSKDNTSSDIDNPYLQTPNLIVQQKNKRQNKKKQPRKSKGKNKFSPNISSEMMQCENQSLNPLDGTLKPDDKPCSGNTQLNPTKSEISKFTLNLPSPKCSDNDKAQSTAEQKGEPLVYMTFEEQSPPEENFEDILKPVSSIKKEKDLSPPRESMKKTSKISSDMLSVVKNIKQEKGDFLQPESQVSELSNITPSDYNRAPTHLSQVEDTQSIVSSVASSSNIDDESSMSTLSNFDISMDLNLKVRSKSKKKRPRTYGWCKKKKSRSKSKAKPQSFPSVEIKECSNQSEMAPNKVPVVIIKNWLPTDGIEKTSNSGSVEQETVELPAKSKKKKKATSRKKKKAAKRNQNSTNNEVAQKDIESEGHKDADGPNCSLQSESAKLLEEDDLRKDTSASIVVPVSNLCSEIPVTSSENSSISDHLNPAKKPRGTNDCGVHSNLTDSSVIVPRNTPFPSLDVIEISQELQELMKNPLESSDKSRQNSLDYDSREELNVPPKISTPNILETFNMSPKSRKSKNFNSFEPLANVQIKKEPDYDPKSSVYCPREGSVLSSNKNDKTDNSCNIAPISNENRCLLINKEISVKDTACNMSSSDLSHIKKEKEARSDIKDKSEISTTSSKISDKPVLENPSDKITDSVSKMNTNLAVQSELLKNLSQSPLSVDIDKFALSIKKEVYGEAKSKSSNFSIKDQNDLIKKACTSQPQKLITAPSVLPGSTTTTKSVHPLKSQSSGSVQVYNLEGEDEEEEIQILQIANHKNSKDVPIVDLTEENINDPAAEIQGVSLECKDESKKILTTHINTAKVSDFSSRVTQKNVQEHNPSALHSSARQINADHINTMQGYAIQSNAVQSIPAQINSKTVCDQFYKLDKMIKSENSNVINSIVNTPASTLKLEEKLFLEENKQVIIGNKTNNASLEELRKNNTEDSVKSVTNEKEEFKIETSNSTISKDKYFEEYFKHPFPPSLVLHNTKQRNKNKMYTRINSKAWNLTLEEVEARLKLSENIIPRVDGVAVKLEEYPVSVNEVECYHRILGVAPSQKLLFKCFKSPEKKVNTFINNGFNAFPTFSQASINNIESEKKFNNKMTCSLEDILKGITETRMMYSNNNAGNVFPVTGKDCPSTESRDSSDSFISNMSGVQSRDLKTVDNVNAIGNEFIHNDNSNSRSSTLSCRLPTFSEGDITNVSFKAPKTSADQFVSSLNSNENINFVQSQSTLNSFNLPTQETANSIVNTCNPSSSCVGNYSEMRSNIPNSIEAQSSSCHSFTTATEFKSNDDSKLQTEKKQVFGIDVPVTELLKILKAAKSLPSDSVNLDNRLEDRSLWKSQATYEYNHTRSQETYEYNHTWSVPVEKSSEFDNLNVGALSSQVTSCNNFVSQPTPPQDKTSGRQVVTEAITVSKPTLNTCTSNVKEVAESEQSSLAKKSVQEDSDSDCVDNEPFCNDDDDDDRENDENSSHTEEQTTEERPVPQYKSKWEKIMERKSLQKEKEIINEHMLKDCFPVKSTRTLNVVSHKNISKTNEKTEKPTKSTSSEKKQNNDKIGKQAKQKQNDSNSNLEMQNDKSSKSKKSIEEKKTKTISEKETKNKTSVEKKTKTISEKETKNKESVEKKSKTISEKETTNKESVEKNKTKNTSEKNKASISKKNKLSDNGSSNLFVPDRPLKVSKGLKQGVIHQSNENNKSKRFYGNRVTNRGTFLTESSSSSELLKKIKIPKKKKLEVPKKNFNVRPEECNKYPDFNVEVAVRPYKTFNKSFDSRKNSEYYRSPLENASSSSSSSSHFIRTKHARGRRMYHSEYHPQERQRYSKMNYDPRSRQPKNFHDEIGGRRTLLSTPPDISSLMNDENSMNRRPPLLSSPPISFFENDEITGVRKTSQFNILPSLSSQQSNDRNLMGSNNSHLVPLTSSSSHPCNDESLLHKNIPNLTLPSITPNLPAESFQPVVSSTTDIINSILSVLKSNQISTVPEKDCEPPFSDSTNLSWDNSLAYNFKETSRQSMNLQVNIPGDPATSLNKSYGNIHPREYFNNSKPSPTHPLPTATPKNPFDSILDTSVPVNSPPFTSSVNSSNHIPPQPSRKASCLVPKHLKTLVGHKTIETHNVRLLMLEWSVDWLVQQQQFHDPPPISNALKKVVSTYDSFEDYYNTYFPLMLLETWHRIYVSWTHLNQANPYSCQITSYSVKSHYVSVECQTVFNTAAHPKGVFPDEGSILMVKYTTKSNEYTIKILGYVTNVKTRRFNNVTDSKLFSSLRMYKDVNPDVLQILSLTFMGAYNSEDIDKRQPIRIHVLCNVKPTLKQNDAMLFINNSPLHRSILNPVADGLLSFTLSPRNSPLEKTNECVRDITKGILTPHPLPLLTVVRAKPESDRLNIIPLLIEKMKCAYKTKVLLCVRTVRALGDIAANICLHQSLKLVIINKRCDTNPQFQKFLLDDLAAAEMSKNSEDKTNEKHHAKNDTIVKLKKQVLKECDVVLSLVRNCHDEFIGDTFTETDCVSQMCCIVDEANLCTEPETLIPILHGISKLILIGDSDYPAKVLSKTASAYDYSQSFFQRAYDLDLITE